MGVPCKNVLHPPERDLLHPYRPYTSLLMILPILHLQQPLLTWMPQLFFPVRLPNLESTPRSILLTPPLVCLTPVSSETSTTKLPVPLKSFFKITRVSKISLPSWVWTNFRRTINCLSAVPERYKSSCPSLSTSQKSLLEPPESSLLSKTPSRVSSRSSMVNTMTFLRSPSTWLEISMMSRRRLRRSKVCGIVV